VDGIVNFILSINTWLFVIAVLSCVYFIQIFHLQSFCRSQQSLLSKTAWQMSLIVLSYLCGRPIPLHYYRVLLSRVAGLPIEWSPGCPETDLTSELLRMTSGAVTCLDGCQPAQGVLYSSILLGLPQSWDAHRSAELVSMAGTAAHCRSVAYIKTVASWWWWWWWWLCSLVM